MTLSEVRAIEALRAGVPNRDAVRHLGTDQHTIEQRFVDALGRVATERQAGRQVQGLLVSGDFGAGKSHLLEWLQHLALERHVACSRVVISKESPLHQPHRLYRTAIHSLRLPEAVGGVEEVALRLSQGGDGYGRMVRALEDPDQGFDPVFLASVLVHQRVRDPEIASQMVGFWRGERPDISLLKRTLKSLGVALPVRRTRINDLALPRFRFAALLLGAAGYAGWVILLDEVELIASFSVPARAGAYASLATLLGLVPERALPGVLTAATVTDDLATVVLDRRHDRERIPDKLGDRDPELVRRSLVGMDAIRPGSPQLVSLEPAGAAVVRATHARVRSLYGSAYGWAPTDDAVVVRERSWRMRQYVRDWITRWDLTRIDPGYRPDIVTRAYAPDLAERPELERVEEGEGDDDGGG